MARKSDDSYNGNMDDPEGTDVAKPDWEPEAPLTESWIGGKLVAPKSAADELADAVDLMLAGKLVENYRTVLAAKVASYRAS